MGSSGRYGPKHARRHVLTQAPEGARPRPRLTQAEAKERTRRQLLAAAARVFAEKGFAGASLEEIAELAGYSTGAVYYNFAGKEELFLELIRSGWSRQIDRRTETVSHVFAEAADRGGDPFDALSGFMAGRADRDGDVSPLVAEFWLYAIRHPEAMNLVAEKLAEQDQGMEPAIAAAMERFGTPEGISTPEQPPDNSKKRLGRQRLWGVRPRFRCQTLHDNPAVLITARSGGAADNCGERRPFGPPRPAGSPYRALLSRA